MGRPNHSYRYSKDNADKIIRLATVDKLSAHTIGMRMGLSNHSITKVLRDNNFEYEKSSSSWVRSPVFNYCEIASNSYAITSRCGGGKYVESSGKTACELHALELMKKGGTKYRPA